MIMRGTAAMVDDLHGAMGGSLVGAPRPRRSAGRRWLGAAVAVAVAGSGVAVAVASPASADVGGGGVPVVVTASPPGSSEAADQATAMGLAARYGSPVEVLDARTESSQTFAQPDGSLRLVQAASPQRVRRGGGWVKADPTLHRVGDVVVPKASTLDMRFSGGGQGPLLTVTKGDRSLSLQWPGELRAPKLLGDTATYEEVLPGVDLRLAASTDSFSEVLVVKTAQAAKDLGQLRFGLTTAGVSVQQDADTGFIRAVDSSGAPVFVSDGARMWESPRPVPSGAAAVRGAAVRGGSAVESVSSDAPRRSEDLEVRLSAGALTVVPSVEMLRDPSVAYPVFIDPGFNGGKEIWTPVSRANPSSSYWTDKNWRDSMRVGQNWYGASDDDWRTLVQFDVTKLVNTHIIEAGVHVTVGHTGDCTESPFQLWQTNYISKSKAVTWNSTKGKWWSRLSEVQATANKSRCPKGDDQVGFENTAVVKAFQTAATKGNKTITFAFRAKSESDKYQWKKLNPDSALLDINFDHKPNKPTDLKVDQCFQACTGAIVTPARRPTLRMKVSDPDAALSATDKDRNKLGGKLRYEYEVWDSTKKTRKIFSDKAVTGVTSGSSRGWTVTKDLADGLYYWKGRGCDAYVCGPDSAFVGFTVDASNPSRPTVDSDLYKPAGWNGGPGIAGTFTFKPGAAADGVSQYAYALNDAKAVSVPPGADAAKKVGCQWSGTIASCKIEPVKDMLNTLHVWAFDKAGNRAGCPPTAPLAQCPPAEYLFRVSPAGATWYWGLDEGAGSIANSVTDKASEARPATLVGSGVSWSESGRVEGSAAFTGSGNFATALPVVNTTNPEGFTVAAFVKLPGRDPVEMPESSPVGDSDGDGEEPVDEPGDGTGDDPDSEESAPDGGKEADATFPLPQQNLTAVSQSGANTSLFRLGYRIDLDLDNDKTPDPAWCLTVKTADSVTAGERAVCTGEHLATPGWVHLVGVVDGINDEIRLYVNGTPGRYGTLVTATDVPATWEANNALAIGRAGTNTVPGERWTGGIDEVFASSWVWSADDIEARAQGTNGDPLLDTAP